MPRRLLIALSAFCLIPIAVLSQEKTTPIDDVSRQATALEGELGKYNDTSPEASTVMVKLADLYHTNGRVFGLVRVTQRFVAAQPTNPQHPVMMLKLLDGLEVMARHKEFAVIARQFMTRYPKLPQVTAVEVRLANSLEQMPDRLVSAQAHRAVWMRQAGSPVGREHGLLGVSQFALSNAAPVITQGAELAENMLDRSPKGTFADGVGWRSFHEWRRISQWAKSNIVGNKLLKKGLPIDPKRRSELHYYMSESYASLGLYANAVANLKLARSFGENPAYHMQMIVRMNQAAAKPNEMAPVIADYARRYPTHIERHQAQSYLALAYVRAGDNPRAVATYAALLPFDALTNGGASNYVAYNGVELPQVAQAERALVAAIPRNKPHAHYLRYVLGFNIYRDRLKNPARTNQVLRELISQSPSNDTYTTSSISWLFDHPNNEAEFRRDVTAILASRRQNLHMATFRNHPAAWAKAAQKPKQQAAKAAGTALKATQAALAKSNTAVLAADKALKAAVVKAATAKAAAAKNKTKVPAATAAATAVTTATTALKTAKDAQAKAVIVVADADKAFKAAEEAKLRPAYVAAAVQKADADPIVQAWVSGAVTNDRAAQASRTKLLQPPLFAQLNDALAMEVLRNEGSYLWSYAGTANRAKAPAVYGQMTKRFPKDFASAVAYLQVSSDYGTPEVAKEAALHVIALEPEYKSTDIWRRLMLTADRNKDPVLAKAAFAWIKKSETKFGLEPLYAAYIGDILVKYEMEPDALAYWKQYAIFNRDHYDSRECAIRLLTRLEDPAKPAFFLQQVKDINDMHGRYAGWLADHYLKAKDLNNFAKTLQTARARQNERPFRGWDLDESMIQSWVDTTRANMEMPEAEKRAIYTAVRAFGAGRPSAAASLALLELPEATPRPVMTRLFAYGETTRMVGNSTTDWDRLLPYVQSALARKDFISSATLLTGMLANIPSIDAGRKTLGREKVAQSYARMGAVGLTIDENSPLAPLQQAALYLRLGDENLAFETYTANKALFDEHRNELPVDLVTFVCERYMAAGGDENHELVEDVLRGWLVKNSESKTIEDTTKAKIQLLLARNFFKAQRYDIARTEYTTVSNRYPETSQAVEAQFGIGETFMAQKVFDQAEAVFDKLANSRSAGIVVRAEFLRGVLAYRRGDRDDARDIFRKVLDRVPNVELANQALFSLAEVYGDEERYIDQLNLLRTVGRLGRSSKRWHKPGVALSIVVQDSDLGISRGHNRIPVIVRTEPGGDEELIYLTSGGAGKGLFRADLETRLGQVSKNDKVLQLTGNDRVKCDYPAEFKKEFKHVPLSDVEIRVAADAKFEVASSKIIDKEAETFSQQLEREAAEANDADKRVSQGRPANQIKPGNLVYFRVDDPDRDLSDEADKIVVRLVADSGDQVQLEMVETGPHTGRFEGTAKTGELPAGALASDTAIQHNPLMAIDKDPKTFWLSEPDGATPKWLTVDMKDLKSVARVKFNTPNAEQQSPVRGTLLGSDDGMFWFRLGGNPTTPAAIPVADEFGQMKQRLYSGNFTPYTTWSQIVTLSKNSKPFEESAPEVLTWKRPELATDATVAFAAIWHGKFVQERTSAVRFAVTGVTNAVSIDGILELPVGRGNRHVDVWLEAGTHNLTIFSAHTNGQQPVGATVAVSDHRATQIAVRPFRKSDFDLTLPAATQKSAPVIAAADIVLASDAADVVKTTPTFGVPKEGESSAITSWNALTDRASWRFSSDKRGLFDVWIECAHVGEGGTCRVVFGERIFELTVPNTGAKNKFQKVLVGTIAVDKPGMQAISVEPLEIKGEGLMELQSVTLVPANGARMLATDTSWEFRFAPIKLRYVRLIVHEYLGEALAVNHIEVGGETPGEIHIPTEVDILSLALNDVLEIAGGDTVTATYTDEMTQSTLGQSRLLTGELQATYFNGEVAPIAYELFKQPGGGIGTIRKDLMRVDPGERIVFEITDYDQDRTDKPDSIKIQVFVNDGDPVELTAVETEENSGLFTKEVDTSAKSEKDKLQVKPGDRIFCRYVDEQNTFPGHSVPREAVVYVNSPTDGRIRLLETRIVPPPEGSTAPARVTYQLPAEDKDISGVAFEAPLTVEVIDPDAAKDSRSYVDVMLTTSDGAKVKVRCVISGAYSQNLQAIPDTKWPLREGRFIGQAILQLGGQNSPQLVPLTSEMPRNLIGGPITDDEDEAAAQEQALVTRVLNLTGKDVITSTYNDKHRPGAKPKAKPLALTAKGRLISNGELAITDRAYDKRVVKLHVGERLFLMVTDADRDTSDERDFTEVEISTERGEKEVAKLYETLAHSGVFTGSLALSPNEKPIAGNLKEGAPIIESYFGDTLNLRYVDPSASTETGELEIVTEIPVVIGTDGLVAAFSKAFSDENLAVETKFHISESYFELFKSHNTLGREDEIKADLESGRRVLREVMEDYPDPKYVPRIAYLLGQFAQELKQWDEAIESYEMIVRRYPDHLLAPDAQYKLAQAHEEAGDFDEALEAYVTLAATYPKSPLIANVMIRISDHFYKSERYDVAAQVGEKFLDRFEAHEHASRMGFRVGQCYFKAKDYNTAGAAFDVFAKRFPDAPLCADSLFWSGESFRLAKNNREAYRRYNRCRWDFPASDAAKYSRGRLALPEILQQFEADVNNLDNP
jgi:TolA-binding protein